MPYDFANVFVFAVSAIGFCLLNLVIGALLRPSFPQAEKAMIYECGEKPIGSAWFNFNPRFYIIALVFVIFEVEIALMLPVALVYKSFVKAGVGGLAFFEVLAFVLILAVGLVWIWAHGDLEWIKKVAADMDNERRAAAASAVARKR